MIGISFTLCKLGKLLLVFDSHRASWENYFWDLIHAVQPRKITVGIRFTLCNLGKLLLVFDSRRAISENYFWYLIHTEEPGKIVA